MQVVRYERLDDLPAETAEALSYRAGQPFFRSLEWFGCLAAHGIDPLAKLRIYVASDGPAAQCALFCVEELPRHLSSLTTFYTMEYGPLAAGSGAAAGLDAIVAFIAAERPRWHTVELRYLLENGPEQAALAGALSANRFGVHPYYQYDNWYLDVGGRSFETYYNGLSSRLRNTIKRKGRKAAREHDLKLALYPRDGLTLADAVAAYEKIYMQSWKQAEPFPDFMPALFATCADLDIARVGLATVDGEPAAAQIWINDHDRTLIYKLAYDEKYAPLSIGSVLSRELFEHAIDIDKVREIDYGVGNENYKRDWMSARRALGGLLACNRATLRGRLRDLRENAAALLRKRSNSDAAD